MKQETLKLTLEALGEACGGRCNAEYNPCLQMQAIIAIKEGMALPKQEPAVFLNEWSDWRNMVVQNLMRHGGIDKDLARRLAHFYQDSAPQRTWAGLTEEEREEAMDWCVAYGVGAAVDWISNTLKDKNT